jgi:hypothetical protein
VLLTGRTADAGFGPIDADLTDSPDAPLPAFLPPARIELPASSGAYFLVVADFNRDGRDDIAVIERRANQVGVLLNTTITGTIGPTFAAPVNLTTGFDATQAAAADFNGDGAQDLAITNPTQSRVEVHLNTTPALATTASFATRAPFATDPDPSQLPTSLAIGDLDGDGSVDLAVGSFGNPPTSGKVTLLRNTTAMSATVPTFAAKVELDAGLGVHDVVIADFDADGKRDLAVLNTSSARVSILRNTTAPTASLSFAAPLEFATAMDPRDLAVGDLNFDGRPDLVAASKFESSVSALMNTTATPDTVTFATYADHAVGAWPIAVAVSRPRHSLFPWVVAANQGSDSLTVLYGGFKVPRRCAARRVDERRCDRGLQWRRPEGPRRNGCRCGFDRDRAGSLTHSERRR